MCDEIRLALAEVRRRTPSAEPAFGPRGTTPRLTVRGTAAGAPPPPPPPTTTCHPCLPLHTAQPYHHLPPLPPAPHCTALPPPATPSSRSTLHSPTTTCHPFLPLHTAQSYHHLPPVPPAPHCTVLPPPATRSSRSTLHSPTTTCHPFLPLHTAQPYHHLPPLPPAPHCTVLPPPATPSSRSTLHSPTTTCHPFLPLHTAQPYHHLPPLPPAPHCTALPPPATRSSRSTLHSPTTTRHPFLPLHTARPHHHLPLPPPLHSLSTLTLQGAANGCSSCRSICKSVRIWNWPVSGCSSAIKSSLLPSGCRSRRGRDPRWTSADSRPLAWRACCSPPKAPPPAKVCTLWACVSLRPAEDWHTQTHTHVPCAPSPLCSSGAWSTHTGSRTRVRGAEGHRGTEAQGHRGSGALEGEEPQRGAQRRLDRRLEEVAEAVGGGYCRLQMPLRLAFADSGWA